MKGGGELLRAILDQGAVYANPAIYTVCLDGSVATARGFLQLHKSLWFLQTGYVPISTDGAIGVGFQRMDVNEKVRIFDPNSNDQVYFRPDLAISSLTADTTLNNPFTLPEYLLWEPASLIGVEWTGNAFAGRVRFLNLVGIEYGMRD